MAVCDSTSLQTDPIMEFSIPESVLGKTDGCIDHSLPEGRDRMSASMSNIPGMCHAEALLGWSDT